MKKLPFLLCCLLVGLPAIHGYSWAKEAKCHFDILNDKSKYDKNSGKTYDVVVFVNIQYRHKGEIFPIPDVYQKDKMVLPGPSLNAAKAQLNAMAIKYATETLASQCKSKGCAKPNN